MASIELVHAAAVFALTGLIWTIQLVHYPMFKFVEAPHWPRFHALHSRNITFIVFPLMLLELMTSLQFFVDIKSPTNTIFLACAATTWLLTFLIFIPLHGKVANRPIAKVFDKLVAFNWARVATWTICSAATFVDLRVN